MRKILIALIISIFFSNNAFAGCGLGWTVGHIFDFSKEHRVCAKLAREASGDSFAKNDTYCDCRESLQLRKWVEDK